jgi:hypothetical protein
MIDRRQFNLMLTSSALASVMWAEAWLVWGCSRHG